MSISISNTSGYVAPSSLIQSGKSSKVNSGTDSDGDGGVGGRRIHKGHGGGHMQQAMMQALQSLGLAAPGQPQATSGSSPTSPSSTSTDSDGDSDGSLSIPT